MGKKVKKVTQKDKAKIRHTPEWNDLRQSVSDDFDRKDPISLKPLRTGWNLHHMDLDENHYSDFTKETEDGDKRFIPLNKQQHELIHILYRYACKDPDYITRLLKYLDVMIKLNK